MWTAEDTEILREAEPELKSKGVVAVVLSKGAGFWITIELLEAQIAQAKAEHEPNLLILVASKKDAKPLPQNMN